MILVVDDDEQVRGSLARILGRHEHETRAAGSVVGARARLHDYGDG